MEDLIWPKSYNVHQESSAFIMKFLHRSLYLEMENLGHLAKILKCAPGVFDLQNEAFE